MCFSTIEGIEVEERRRRYPNEPRRKRLKFVKDRNSFKHSDEWIRPPRRGMRDQFPPGQQYFPPPPSYGGYPPPPPPPPPLHFPPPPQPLQQRDFHGQGPEGFIPHPHNNFGNGIERVEEYRPAHQNHPQEISPHCVEIRPRYREPELRAHMPSNLQVNIRRSRSRSRSRGRRGHSQRGESRRGRSRSRTSSRGPRGGYRHRSVYSDDTIVDSNTGSYISRRRHSRRPRSFGVESYDSFDGSQTPRSYSRSVRRRRRR